MRQLFFFGLILAALTSCKQINVDKEILLIDSLKAEITNAEIKINELDMDKVKTVHEQIGNQIMLAKSMYGDSIEWDNAKLLTKYYAISKSFGKFIDKQSYLVSELDFSHTQLLDLKLDLENNILPLDSFYSYFKIECKAMVDIKVVIDVEIGKAKDNMELYEDFSTEIKGLLENPNIN